MVRQISSVQKAVVISGGGSGIGAATALEFSRNGYFVILLGRDREKLNQTLKRMPAPGLAVACEIGETSQVEKAVEKIQTLKDIRIEVLVNNAGIYLPKAIMEANESDWQNHFNVNLFGAVRLIRALWGEFIQNKSGSIVNVSSTLGLRPVAGTAAYSASKAAMVNLTQTLALEGGPFNIRANCVCPGIVDTPIHSFHLLSAESKAQALDKMKDLQPLKRIGTPEEIAKAIYFLGGDQSPWTTGAVLSVDGGIHLQ